MGEVGMGRKDALNILLRSNSPHFRSSARAELRKLKNPKKYKAEQKAVKAGGNALKSAANAFSKKLGAPKKKRTKKKKR